jgi:hypothetical protein
MSGSLDLPRLPTLLEGQLRGRFADHRSRKRRISRRHVSRCFRIRRFIEGDQSVEIIGQLPEPYARFVKGVVSARRNRRDFDRPSNDQCGGKNGPRMCFVWIHEGLLLSHEVLGCRAADPAFRARRRLRRRRHAEYLLVAASPILQHPCTLGLGTRLAIATCGRHRCHPIRCASGAASAMSMSCSDCARRLAGRALT